jgi:hypothetical protein
VRRALRHGHTHLGVKVRHMRGKRRPSRVRLRPRPGGRERDELRSRSPRKAFSAVPRNASWQHGVRGAHAAGPALSLTDQTARGHRPAGAERPGYSSSRQ